MRIKSFIKRTLYKILLKLSSTSGDILSAACACPAGIGLGDFENCNHVGVVKRVQAGWRAWKKVTGIICDRTVPDKIKGRLYKVMVRPAMLYGMEAVAVTKAQERKMEVAEMKMLRLSIGKTRLDRIRNEEVRRRLGVVELGHQLKRECAGWGI